MTTSNKNNDAEIGAYVRRRAWYILGGVRRTIAYDKKIIKDAQQALDEVKEGERNVIHIACENMILHVEQRIREFEEVLKELEELGVE